MTRFFFRGVLAATTILLAATRANAQDFKIIAHPGVAASDVSAAELSKIFLKQSNKFADGASAVPVDQAKSAAVRAAFSQKVLGKSVGAVDTYWQQQIFSGKDVPPASKGSDDEVVAFVKATPGAVGYVSAGAATAGAKVISVK
jgi:ABC-type phosphate transport system substrate-binding protein